MVIPLSFHPDLAVSDVLLLPDGDQPLEAVDSFKSGGEGCFAVSRRHHDYDTRLADFKPAEAVHHGDAADLKRTGDVAPDLRHHLDRHRLIAFVIEEQRRAAFG